MSRDFDMVELRSLRHEVLLRMAVQNAVLVGLIPMFVACVLAGALAPGAAGLAATGFVVAAFMGALIWCHCGARQAQLKAYLLVLEARLADGPGWETWLPTHRFGGLLGARWFISTKGLILGAQAAALAAGWWARGAPDAAAFAVGVAVTAATAWLLLTNPKEGLGGAGAVQSGG